MSAERLYHFDSFLKRISVAWILLSIVIAIAGAQTPADRQKLEQETQARGYWLDDSTGLMWTGKDNGKNLNWHGAIRYCHDLRLADHSDWRLPTIEELEGIYDGSAYASLPARPGITWALAGRAKGGLALTGVHHWSSTRVPDDRGKLSGYAQFYNFPHGWRDKDPLGYDAEKRALCVRP